MEKFFMDDASYMAYINRQAAILDYNSGINAAHEEGFEKGFEKGLEQGREEGREEGEEKGEEKLLRLMNALYKAGRQDDIAKLHSDKTFRENLYKEFNIV